MRPIRTDSYCRFTLGLRSTCWLVAAICHLSQLTSGDDLAEREAREAVAASPFEVGRIDGLKINAIALRLTNDGQTVYAAERKNSVSVWSVSSRTKIRDFQMPGREPSAIALSADGTFLIVATRDGFLSRWDTRSGVLKWEVPAPNKRSIIGSIALSPDDRFIAVGQSDYPARVVDSGNGQTKAIFQQPNQHVNFWVTGFLDNEYAIFAGYTSKNQPNLVVWEIATGQVKATLSGQAEDVVQVDSTGKWLLARYLGTVRFWRVADVHRSIAESRTTDTPGFVLQTGMVESLAYFRVPFDHWTFAGSAVRVQTDPPSGVDRLPPQSLRLGECRDLSRDGRTAVVGTWDNAIRIWDLTRHGDSNQWVGATGFLSTNTDGTFLFRSTGAVWDTRTGQDLINQASAGSWESGSLNYSAIYRDGNAFYGVLSGSGRKPGEATARQVIVRKNLQKAEQLNITLEYQPVWVSADRTGELLAVGYASPLPKSTTAQPGPSMQTAPLEMDSALQLYDRGLNRIASFAEHIQAGVKRVAFSPQSRRIASLSQDNSVRIFDTNSRRQIGSPIPATGVSDLAVTDDGFVCLTADRASLSCFEGQTGRQIAKLDQAHLGNIKCCAVTPNGQILATLATDSVVKLWSIPDLRLLGSLKTPQNWQAAPSLVFLDNDRLAGADWSTPAQIWQIKQAMTGSKR